VIRPSYTLGGTGGGFVMKEKTNSTRRSNAACRLPTHEVLVEKAVLGWKEFELELLRDAKTTTWSSSVRSKTSTPWASTPATASPWRRP
jgi:carbamoylphosphate synthase large subunit